MMKGTCKTCGSKCDPIRHIAWILVIIGALNWGLVGIFQWDLVGGIFGPGSIIARIVFILVAAAGLYLIFACAGCKQGDKKCCTDGSCDEHDKDASTTSATMSGMSHGGTMSDDDDADDAEDDKMLM